jgi:hypothetical protein
MFFGQSIFERALSWVGIGIEYLVAGLIFAGGAYLFFLFNVDPASKIVWVLRPLRLVGGALMLLAACLASVTYGKSVGAAGCEARWKKANYEARLAQLKQEADAKQIAIDTANQEIKRMEGENENLQGQLGDYSAAVSQLSDSMESCRRATDDDDWRMRQPSGPSPKGSKPSAHGPKTR